MNKIRVFIFAFVLFCLTATLTSIEIIDKDKILNHNIQWKKLYQQYRCNLEKIGRLKSKISDGLKIDVYLGLWCGDSKKNVPIFIKLIDLLKNDFLEINYISVERSDKEGKYFVQEFKVEKLPTFIFYRNTIEIGRIIGNPAKSIIDDFLEILF